jgi:hypothetical protein
MNLYDTAVLNGVVQSLKRPKAFLLNTVFGTVQTSTAEHIVVDMLIGNRRVAPFVSPLVAGKVATQDGFVSKTFKPAYVKPKAVVDANRHFTRQAGEQIGGSLNPQERLMATVRSILEDHADQIARRLELMAAEALRLGQVTVTGEGFPTQVVSFSRATALTITLTGVDRWSEASATPLDDIEAWAEMVHKTEGAVITNIVMDPDAWAAFRKSESVLKLLDVRRAAGNPVELGPSQYVGGAQMKGTIGSFNIWVYSEYYTDPETDAITPLLPSGTVLGFGPNVEGVQAFGAIRDEASGLQALPIFAKSWVQEDPSARFIMSQSAPLVYPRRPNGSFAATVL